MVGGGVVGGGTFFFFFFFFFLASSVGGIEGGWRHGRLPGHEYLGVIGAWPTTLWPANVDVRALVLPFKHLLHARLVRDWQLSLVQ